MRFVCLCLLPSCVLVLVLCCHLALAEGPAKVVTKAHFVGRTGPTPPLTLEVADTPATQARGLMHRRRLPERTGMLFAFADAAPRSFWMKDTLVPLDLIFVGSACQVVHIIADATPGSTTNLVCPLKSQYVIELMGGSAKQLRIAIGNRLVASLGPAASLGCPPPEEAPGASAAPEPMPAPKP